VQLRSWRTPEWGWRRRLAIAGAFVVVVASILAATVAAKGPFFWYSCSLDGLQPQGQSQVSYLFGADGTRIGVIPASRKRIPIGFRAISPEMRRAIVAAEDRRFYENNGIDYVAIVRALAADVGAGHVSQGGSTLTQQLVRNLYLGPQRTISRKLTEACLAVQLDRRWSKQAILTAYLNDVYFGHGAYGIEAAAVIFFGKHASDLTLAEAALLAGMPQAPTDYDPFAHPAAARARRAEVLRAMLDTGDITRSQYLEALRSPLGLHPGTVGVSGAGPYLTDYITSRLIDLYGAERVRRGGLSVYTTLDGKLQREATQAIKSTLDRKGDPAGTIVSIDPRNGAIRAMAVAQTGHRLAFDIAADGRRQAGSTFKTFVLTQAVLRGINPWATHYLSAPFTGPNNWRVQTYEHTYSGRIPLTEATVLSDNTVFARLTLDLGPQSIADLAQTMGVKSPLRPVPSLGLGANPISPLDLATAYATLAAGGVRHTPGMITKVVFPDGHSARPSSSSTTRVLDPKVAAAVTKVLAENVKTGTGTAAALSGRPVAGKTGTTDNWTDAWFAGYTPQLATVSWVGYPTRERPMTDVHGIQVVGGSFPAEIWHTYMTAALQGQAVLQFPDPGPPPYHRWCGRFQFARTAAQARPDNVCPAPRLKNAKKTKTQSTTTVTTTAPTTTQTVQIHTTTTAPKPKPPVNTTTTTPTTTQGSGGYQTQPDASPAVGQDGTVVKRVDGAGNGVIQVGGDYYKAMSSDGQPIAAGTPVTVQDAQGDTAIVQAQQ
jgi:penicillin-binding protein 1A